jgi:hypothetical protein
MQSSWQMGWTAKASGRAMPRVDRSEPVVSSRHPNNHVGQTAGLLGRATARAVGLWRLLAPTDKNQQTESGNGGNEPGRTLSVFFLFWEGVRRLVARVAGGGLQTMSIAGQVSRAMLSRYSHVRMEAKRRALAEIATRQGAADEKHLEKAERRAAKVIAHPLMVQ